MLILSRKLNESIMIDHNIEITVLAVEGEQVKIGIKAPKEVEVHRKEIYLSIKEENEQALVTGTQVLVNFEDYFKKKNN